MKTPQRNKISLIFKAITFLKVKARSKYYQLLINMRGGKCQKGLKVHGPIDIIGNFENLYIGENVSLNHGAIINCSGKVHISDGVTISARCQIQTAFLEGNTTNHSSEDIFIGKNTWIAAGCIVLGKSKIEQNVIVGALSLVKGTLQEGHLYAGSPAQKKKKYNEH